MDRDRSAGPSVMQPTMRGLPENPSHSRRPIPNNHRNVNSNSNSNANVNVNSNVHAHPKGLPSKDASSLQDIPSKDIASTELRRIPSGSNLSLSGNSAVPSTSRSLTGAQVLNLARQSMRIAQDESESQLVDGTAVGREYPTGVTIDWSHRNIEVLPDEVIDIIKNGLERLALSHNKIAEFPARISECSSLWYLNVRYNQFREFPLALCDLKSLEILDLGQNILEYLPNDIVRLTSLKVLSLRENRMIELPLCLADMVSLQRLKLEGNDALTFPPREVLQEVGTPPHDGLPRDADLTEREKAVTARIKKYLKQYALNESANDESSEGHEMPRLPTKRIVSGRFPVKVNGANVPDLRSPALSRPPPIPTRSHYRGLSQQNTAIRRPGVMPLTIGNVNERVRSNSETLMASRSERTSRRMGIVSKKTQELGTLDESQASNRFSHYRGLSHGSAMQGNGNSLLGTKAPNASNEPYLQRPIYVRRLSILPEKKRESKVFDPVVEAAKGILYSVFQIHPMIQMLMSLTSDGSTKRSSLEIVFYNTNSHVEELEQELQKHDPANVEEEGSAIRENENVHRACQALVGAYTHVCALLANSIDTFVDKGDPRYIRSLLSLLYNSIMELRVTLASLQQAQDGYRAPVDEETIGGTVRARSRENSVTPTGDRLTGLRSRNPPVQAASSLRVATDVPAVYHSGSNSRTVSLTAATPRSGESFTSASSRSIATDLADEDRQFEKVFLSLQKSSDLLLRILPGFNAQTAGLLKREMAQRQPDMVVVGLLQNIIVQCANSIKHTEALKKQLSMVKLKDPGLRSQSAFWNASCGFIVSWGDTGESILEAFKNQLGSLFPRDARYRLRPVHNSVKESRDVILQSPWHEALSKAIDDNGQNSSGNSPRFDAQGLSPMQMPMTPQSAALGPAVQATVPSTPQSGSFAASYNTGNGFERADALVSMGGGGGLSMGSRQNTMSSATTTGGSSFNSMSSFSSLSDIGSPGSMTPQMSMVPPLQARMNGAPASRGVY